MTTRLEKQQQEQQRNLLLIKLKEEWPNCTINVARHSSSSSPVLDIKIMHKDEKQSTRMSFAIDVREEKYHVKKLRGSTWNEPATPELIDLGKFYILEHLSKKSEQCQPYSKMFEEFISILELNREVLEQYMIKQASIHNPGYTHLNDLISHLQYWATFYKPRCSTKYIDLNPFYVIRQIEVKYPTSVTIPGWAPATRVFPVQFNIALDKTSNVLCVNGNPNFQDFINVLKENSWSIQSSLLTLC